MLDKMTAEEVLGAYRQDMESVVAQSRDYTERFLKELDKFEKRSRKSRIVVGEAKDGE